MAKFVITDFTDPKIVLQEIEYIVRNIAVPVCPILLEGEQEPVTLSDLRRGHHLLLATHYYRNIDDLLISFQEMIISRAEEKVKELRQL